MIDSKKGQEGFCPATRQDWREWLEENHDKQQSVWLIYYKRNSEVRSITYNEAVEEALCFGWIDSTRKSLDDNRFTQFFCKRKPNSVWSKVNKEKVQRLIEEGLMTEAGCKSIETAKQNGSWSILDEVEELIIPKDLEAVFNSHPGSRDYFLSLSRSVRKGILQWLVLAKQEQTRQRRIMEIAELAAQKLKPKQFR
ncbi:YdeI/OmpD-associated family protein [Desertivirga xinjiangensis]|uniref:YdeI/OmpD-associated family protein n=1 Tax=Desertivirga xinjiangensis TaxID=539206 RepID=UPI00210A47B5|nr:YdeI/OmpD-associated family protein [Pedobacter xinjiangensis]